ncbi:MAG: gamma carbonic anhydrase family protein [Proteobacteria bacterium]|nr:MAG: gamma carbonic anhydrase family protein [Pseudomonadota bacterium]
MIIPHHGKWPEIHETAFLAPTVDVIGEVTIGAHSSVWFQCVLRGDVNWIKIGERTNIQDLTMLHVHRNHRPLLIGNEVTVGHRVMIHGCTIGDRCLIGMGSIIMDGAVIGEDCIIGAGAIVTENTVIPPRSLVIGVPGRVKRELTGDEIAYLKKSAENYVQDSREYRSYLSGPVRYGVNNDDLENLDDGGGDPDSETFE